MKKWGGKEWGLLINDARIFSFICLLLCCFLPDISNRVIVKRKNYKTGDVKIILEVVPYKGARGRVLNPRFVIKYAMLRPNAFPFLVKRLCKEGDLR